MEEYIKESKDMISEEDFIGVYDYELLNKRLSAGREQIKYNEGILKGITETAKNLLKNKVSIDIISASTGLSLDEIKSLK